MEPLPACSLRLELSLSPAAFYGTPLASFKRSRAHRKWQANELHAATLAPSPTTCNQQEQEQEKENTAESTSKTSPHFRTPLPLTTQAAVLCSRWPYLPPPPEPADAAAATSKEDEITPAAYTRERRQLHAALSSPLALLPPPLGPLLLPSPSASGEKPRRARHTDALRALAAAAAANCTIDVPRRSFRAAPASLSPVLVKPTAASVRPRAISSV